MALNPIKALTSSNFTKGVAKSITNGFNKLCYNFGNAFEKSPKKDLFIKIDNVIEPTRGSNSFPVFLTMMLAAVVIPRVVTALKRNPDDKEATQDEIKEILFRDMQTIACILLATNTVAAIISGKMTSKSGLPLTNKPFEKVFDTTATGLKGLKEKASEYAHNPIDKTKKNLKNLLSALNPMGGVNASTNEQLASKYTGFESIDDIKKVFNRIQNERGNKAKVFDIVLDTLIEKQQSIINNAQNIQKAGGSADCEKMEAVLKELQSIKQAGVEKFLESNSDELANTKAGKQIIEFFKDKNNALYEKGKNLNGVVRTISWAFNILYLGFGLPALNQKRLEKKYLNADEKKPDGVKTVKKEEIENTNSLNGHKLTVNEVKIFSPFVK